MIFYSITFVNILFIVFVIVRFFVIWIWICVFLNAEMKSIKQTNTQSTSIIAKPTPNNNNNNNKNVTYKALTTEVSKRYKNQTFELPFLRSAPLFWWWIFVVIFDVVVNESGVENLPTWIVLLSLTPSVNISYISKKQDKLSFVLVCKCVRILHPLKNIHCMTWETRRVIICGWFYFNKIYRRIHVFIKQLFKINTNIKRECITKVLMSVYHKVSAILSSQSTICLSQVYKLHIYRS